MKVKFSGMGVVDGRGKINGTVASKNRSGAYLRVKVSGVNPQTTYQLEARNRLTSFSQAWRGLSDADRATWNGAVSDFARTDIFGDLRNPTGKNLFTRLNTNLALIGVAPLTVAPSPAGGGSVIAGAAVAASGGAKSIAHTGDAAGFTIQVWATPSVSPGKAFLKGDYRLITTFTGGAVSPAVVTTAYNARFGDVTPGSRVGFRLVSTNDATGETGTPSESTVIAS